MAHENVIVGTLAMDEGRYFCDAVELAEQSDQVAATYPRLLPIPRSRARETDCYFFR